MPDCERCGGAGFVLSQDEHGVDRFRRCPSCSADRLPRGCERFVDAKRETIDEELWAAATERFPERMLYLWGAIGTGKTWLAVALARSRGAFGFLWWPDWTKRHLVEDRENPAVALAELDRIVASKTLVLDDIGSETDSDFGRLVLARILEPRLDAGVATILTGNYDLDRMANRYDDRIASRLRGAAEVWQMSGPDRRGG